MTCRMHDTMQVLCVAGACKSILRASYALSLAPPQEDEHFVLKDNLLARAGWLQNHCLHPTMTKVWSLTPSFVPAMSTSCMRAHMIYSGSLHQARLHIHLTTTCHLCHGCTSWKGGEHGMNAETNVEADNNL